MYKFFGGIMYKIIMYKIIMYKVIMYKIIMYKKREHSLNHAPFSPRYFFSSVLYRLYS